MASDQFDSHSQNLLLSQFNIPGGADYPAFSPQHLSQEVPAKTTKPRKRYRPNHNEIERKRRMLQMQSIHALKNCIPSLQANKSSIIVIVSKAKEYIEYLTRRVKTLETLVLSYDENALNPLDGPPLPNFLESIEIPKTFINNLPNEAPEEKNLPHLSHDPNLFHNLSLTTPTNNTNTTTTTTTTPTTTTMMDSSCQPHDQQNTILSSETNFSSHVSLPPVDTYRQDVKFRPPSLKFSSKDSLNLASLCPRSISSPSSSSFSSASASSASSSHFLDISPTVPSPANFLCVNFMKSPSSTLPLRKFSHPEKSTFPFTPESPVPLHYSVPFIQPSSECNTTINTHVPTSSNPLSLSLPPPNPACLMPVPSNPPPLISPTVHPPTSHYPPSAHFVSSPTAPMCSPLSPFSATVFSPTQPSSFSSDLRITSTETTHDSLKENYVSFFPSSYPSTLSINLSTAQFSNPSHPPHPSGGPLPLPIHSATTSSTVAASTTATGSSVHNHLNLMESPLHRFHSHDTISTKSYSELSNDIHSLTHPVNLKYFTSRDYRIQ